MKKLLLLLLMIPTLVFGQATGYNLGNFATSQTLNIGVADGTLGSRFYVIQTTPSITLSFPKPSNPSSKVVEVWIGNKGTVPFTLIALPDNVGSVIDTGSFVILKWIGDKYYVTGKKPPITDLSGYIKRDGTSAATTGNISIGNGYGLADTSTYQSRSIVSSIGLFKTDANYYGGAMPYKLSAISSTYRNVFGFSDAEMYWNIDNIGNDRAYISITANDGIYFQHQHNSGFGSSLRVDTNGIRLRGYMPYATSRTALIRTSTFTGSGQWVYELPNKGGVFATLDDIPSLTGYVPTTRTLTINGTAYDLSADRSWTISGGVTSVFGRTGSVVATSGDYTTDQVTEATNLYYTDARARASVSATSPLAYNSGTGAFSMPAATTSISGYLSATDWNTFNNKQSALVSGTNIKTLYGATLLGSGDAGITPSAYGGTGVNNGSSTITIGGNVAFTGAFNATFAVPRTTTWTLPNTSLETLAGLATAQTFTAQNTFDNTSGQNIYSLNIWDAGGTPAWKQAVYSGTLNRISLGGSSFTNVSLGSGNWLNVTSSAVALSANSMMLRAAMISSVTSGAGMTIGAVEARVGSGVSIGGVHTATAYLTSTTNSGYTASATPTTNIITADNAVASGSGNSGAIFVGTGLITGASATGVRGDLALSGRNIAFHFANSAYSAPAYNSGVGVFYIPNRTTSPTTNASSGTYFYSNSGNLETTGSLYLPILGTGLGVKTGTNGRLFTSTLIAGTVTSSNTSITTSTKAIITLNSGGSGGTLGAEYDYVCTAGQIVITSLTAAGATQVLDTSTLQVYLIEGL